MREPFVEAAESVEHQRLIRDCLTNIMEGVGEGLYLLAVGGDRLVTLNESPKLSSG